MVLLNEKEKKNTSQLAGLKKKRLIHFTGAPRTGGYVLTKKGKELIDNFEPG